ncbi:MAG: hypothetical protein JNK43_04765 [Ignavibacteria bacterium]|nr:hypothetical protein [Ignavibacteria bacterium]
MKYLKRYYSHFLLLGYVLFAFTSAFTSLSRVPNYEYEFKVNIPGDPNEPLQPVLPPDMKLLNI